MSRNDWKNLELFNQPLDQKLINFKEEKKNFHVRYNVTTMTKQILRIKLLRNRADLESHDIRRRPMSSRSTQRNYASAVPPDLTKDLEAKIEKQNIEIQYSQADLEATRDSQQLG